MKSNYSKIGAGIALGIVFSAAFIQKQNSSKQN